MPLIWTEEQELLRATARSFVEQRSPVSELRRLRDTNDPDGFDRKLWREMAELGWSGIPFPEHLGGAGLGHAELGVVLHECGRTLAASPLLASTALAGNLVWLAGTPAQHERVLAPVCAGHALLAAAIQEGPRHAPHRVRTQARRDGEAYRLRGEKHFVLDGHVADRIAVVARVGGGASERAGLGLFLVARDAAGVGVTRTIMVDGRNAANLVLDDVAVGPEDVLGAPGEAAEALDAALDRATVSLCAEMLGGAEVAFERTLAYLKVREQFGVPIGSFQALKHRAAQMFVELELAKTIVLEALQAIDEQRPDAPSLASTAKARLSETVHLVGNEGVQMHGGIGVTDEEDIGLYLKRFRVQERTLGDASFHRSRYAELAGY